MQHQSRFKAVSLFTWCFLAAGVVPEGVGATLFNPLNLTPFENESVLSVSVQRLPRVALYRPKPFASQFTLKLNNSWLHTANLQFHTGSEYVAFEGYGRQTFNSRLLFEYGAGYQRKLSRKSGAFSAALLTPNLAVSVTQLLPLNGFEKRTPGSRQSVRGAKSITIKLSYKPALLNGLKLHTEVGQFCDKEIRLNSGTLRSRFKLMAAVTYQPYAITSLKYQVSRINAAVYDHQIHAKLSIPITRLSLKRFVHARCSTSDSEVKETLRETLEGEQDSYSVVSKVDSGPCIPCNREESNSLGVAISTTESLPPVPDTIPSWLSEMKNVFSEELVKYSDEALLGLVIENVVSNVTQLERIIPNANKTFFCDPITREQYGDFSKPNNYLSTFASPITDSVCSLICYRLVHDTRTTSLNSPCETKGYFKNLIDWYANLTYFCFVKHNLITREKVVTLYDTVKELPLSNNLDDGTILSRLIHKYTHSGHENIFLDPEENFFTFSKAKVSSPEFLSDFCSKKFFLVAKKVLVPELNCTSWLSEDAPVTSLLKESFAVPDADDGKTCKTIQTLAQRTLSASPHERFQSGYKLTHYETSEKSVEMETLVQEITNLIITKNELEQKDDADIDTLVEGVQGLQSIEAILEQLKHMRANVKKEVRQLSLKRANPLPLVRKITELEERSRGCLQELQELIGSKKGETAKTKALKGLAEKVLMENENKKNG